MEIRLAEKRDLPEYFKHLQRFGLQSVNDEIISSPHEESKELNYSEIELDRIQRWTTPTANVGWERCFILVDPRSGEIRAELVLMHMPALTSSLHRALLMMGIERNYRHKGHGKRLLTEAIQWVTANTTVEWLDLCVFANNIPAIELYKRFGFTEVGRVQDKFRVRGKLITDIEMVLRLNR